MDEFAKDYITDQDSIALAWLIAHPSITVPIASTINQEQLKFLVKAAQLNILAADIGLLTKASS